MVFADISQYVHPDDQPAVFERIQIAITKNHLFEA